MLLSPPFSFCVTKRLGKPLKRKQATGRQRSSGSLGLAGCEACPGGLLCLWAGFALWTSGPALCCAHRFPCEWGMPQGTVTISQAVSKWLLSLYYVRDVSGTRDVGVSPQLQPWLMRNQSRGVPCVSGDFCSISFLVSLSAASVTFGHKIKVYL